MPKLTHSDLIQLGTRLGYNSLTMGLCQGFSCMWAQALLAQDEEQFFNRLELIASYHPDFEALISELEEAKKKARQSSQLSQNDIDLLEILAFFDGIEMYLNPQNHYDLFGKRYVSQVDLNTIYPLIKSTKLEHNELGILFNNDYIFSKASLAIYFKDLEEKLIKADSEYPILLDNAEHSICLKYNKTKQKWFYIDTNDFSRYPDNLTYFRELETTELVNSLFESLSESSAANVLFNMKILSADNQTPKLDAIKASLTELAVNYPVTTEVATACDFRELGLIYLACQDGDLNLVQTLLKNPNIEINQATIEGVTPLYAACQNGYLAVVRALLEYPDIMINEATNDEVTPLYIASQNGHVDIVVELLKQSDILINQERDDETTPLYIACEKGYFAVVAELLKHSKIDVNQLVDGGTVLQLGCYLGHVAIVTLLLKHPNIEVNQADPDGETALYIACEAGHLAVVVELLKHPNIKINQAESNGLTPLYIACQNGNLAIIRELLKQPAIKINQADNNGVTPLYMACQNNQFDVAELLLNTPGININSRGLAKHTPLLVACLSPHTQNNEKLFKLLLQKGANLYHKNEKGQTALDIALEEDNTAALSVLLKFICLYSMNPSALMSPVSLKKALVWAKDQCPEVVGYLTIYQPKVKSPQFFEPLPLSSKVPLNDEPLAPRNSK